MYSEYSSVSESSSWAGTEVVAVVYVVVVVVVAFDWGFDSDCVFENDDDTTWLPFIREDTFTLSDHTLPNCCCISIW